MRLTRFEQRQIRSLIFAILPSGNPHLPLGAADVDAAGTLFRMMDALPLRTLLGMRLVLFALAFSPLWRTARPRTFAGTPPEERIRILQGLLVSPYYYLRQMVFLLREFSCMAYAADPRVRAAIADAARPDARLTPQRPARATEAAR